MKDAAVSLLRVICTVTAGLTLLPVSWADTFVIPHILEKSGRVSDTQFTFDTTIFMTYSAGQAGIAQGNGATVDLYLFDDVTGQPMESGAGVAVCNPCTFTMDATTRKRTVNIEELIETAGGFGGSSVRTGFALLVTGGDDPEAVHLESFVVNSHTSAFDTSTFSPGLQPLSRDAQVPPPDGTPAARRSFVMPHVLERSGRITDTQFTFDTTVFVTYTAGLAGLADGGGATVELYLFDQATGLPMRSGSDQEICNPCTFPMGTGGAASATPRKRSIAIEDLITAAGGFGAQEVRSGFAVVAVTGANPEAVNLQGFVVNSHTSAFDLSVFGFEPQPIQAAQRVDPGSRPASRTVVFPHVLEKSGRVSDTQFTFDTTIFATYGRGLDDGTGGGDGATINFYLFDESTGLPMLGGDGTEVCNPCTFAVGNGMQGAAQRKLAIRLEDLIQNHGGFGMSSVRLGYAVAVVGGADPDGVNLQGFVVNSHTSAFDVSVFGFDPQPLRTALCNLPPGGGTALRTFVIPHVLEVSGNVATDANTFDTTLFATYTRGQDGGPDATNATVDLYLFDQATGMPMQGGGGAEVCNPCSFAIDSSNRAQSINIESLILDHGGFGGTSVKAGYGVVVVGGADPDGVNLQGFVVNAHTGPFDLSVFGYQPEPLQASARTAPPRLTGVGLAADGSFHLRVRGGKRGTLCIQASDDASSWESVGVMVLTGGDDDFFDRNAAGLNRRFYRGVMLQ